MTEQDSNFMEEKRQILICPDYDVLYRVGDEDCCWDDAYGDEICNYDYSRGPLFSVVVPGIEEWLDRFRMATNFAETTTDPEFDWKSWHIQGLLFAKKLRSLIPSVFTLYYKPPYEDKSGTLKCMEIDGDIDGVISKLWVKPSYMNIKPSFKNNVSFKVSHDNDMLTIEAKVGGLVQVFSVKAQALVMWMERVIMDGRDMVDLQMGYPQSLIFFNTTVGIHKNMGQFWIYDKSKRENQFAAYVDKKEFIRALYLSVATELAFGIRPNSSCDEEGMDREYILNAWGPYNSFKSTIVEKFVYDELDVCECRKEDSPLITESFVMFPDYGGCMFWDTMGVGAGEYGCIYVGDNEIVLNVPGLKKWAEYYDSHDDSQTFCEYLKDGWNLALQVRKQLPPHIELFYMCYNPMEPDEIVSYNSHLPRILVPWTK